VVWPVAPPDVRAMGAAALAVGNAYWWQRHTDCFIIDIVQVYGVTEEGASRIVPNEHIRYGSANKIALHDTQ